MDQQPAPRRSSTIPEGVEIRQGKRGDSLRVTFTWMGMRRRETLDIPVTPANIKYAGRLRAEVQNAIERGTFNYESFFPNSKFAKLTAAPTQRRYLFNDLIDSYIDHARKAGAMSPSSISTYVKWARSRLKPQFMLKHVDEITTIDLRTWIAELAAELAPKSVRNCVGLTSSVICRAIEDGLIKTNPLQPIKLKTMLPKKKASEEDKADPFNADDIALILGACSRPQERALFQFAFATGLRTGELIALKWRNIDWKNNSIHVEDNIVSGEYGTVEKETKTGCERDIPMLPAAKAALEIMRPMTSLLNNGDYVFSPDGINRWRHDYQIRARWTIILRTAKVRYRNPYQTRHTFASTLLMNGEPELLVAKLLGHATVEMVRRHYGKYIKQKDGIKLLGTYSEFGADLGQTTQQKTA